MADEFRCPHCEGVIDPAADRCPWCGGSIPRPAEPTPAAGEKGLDIETWFDAPAPPPTSPPPPVEIPPPDLSPPPTPEPEIEIVEPPPEPAGEPLPDTALEPDDVPVVRPAASRRPADLTDLPEAKPLPPAPPPRPAPSRIEPAPAVRTRTDAEEEDVKPRVGLAVVVMLFLFLAVVGGCGVITYAIWAGFKAFSRPKPTAATAKEPAPAPAPDPDQPAGGPEGAPAPRPAPRVWVPAERSFALQPTMATDGSRVPLPAPAKAGYLAGGGRYIVFHLPDPGLLAVFDTVHAAVVKYLPAPGKDLLVAAGMDEVILLDPAGGRVRRFDLTTFKEGKSAPLPAAVGRPVAAAMGHASAGPLAVIARDGKAHRLILLDPDRLTPLPVEIPAFDGGTEFAVRASADGRVIAAAARDDDGYQSQIIAEYKGGRFTVRREEPEQPGRASPTADGAELVPTGAVPNAEGNGSFVLPAKPGRQRVSLVFPGVVERVPGPEVAFDDPPTDAAADRVAFLIPSAKLFASLTDDRTAVRLQAIDLRRLVTKATDEYVLFASDPPRSAVRMSVYTYRPQVWTGGQSAAVRLEDGPDGMAYRDGQVLWVVPQEFPQDAVTVRLTARDGTVSTWQEFAVAVRDTRPPPPLEPAAPTEPKSVRVANPPRRPQPAPPAEVAPRDTYTLVPKAATKGEPVTLTVVEGPPGLRVNAADGSLIWGVPRDYPAGPVPVVVRADPAGGEPTLEAYLVRVTGS